MEHSLWEKLISNWQKSFFTIPLWHISMIIALIFGIKNYQKDKIYLYFLSYTISGLIIFLLYDFLSYYIISPVKDIIRESLNTLFALIEFYLFYYFFSKIFQSKIVKLIMKIICLSFFTLTISFFLSIYMLTLSVTQIEKFSIQITIVEFFFLFFGCLIFYFELFVQEPTSNSPLNLSPAFWIATGLFFYIIIGLPFFLIAESLFKSSQQFYYLMFRIHYISISVLFLCIAKAFSCKKPLMI
jgi:hypothetical protein